MSKNFAQLRLHPELVQTVANLGYSQPTPIQLAVIPVMLAGQDVIGQAKTGTGKTAAFALPVLNNLMLGAGTVQCLVLAPTRELAGQVAKSFSVYGRDLGVRVLAVYGGQAYGPQIKRLEQGVEIVVGTPGRLLDLLKRNSLDLSHVTTVILDEADEMLSMGFIEDIEAILAETPAQRQTALFSATISSQVRRLADSYMHKPQSVTVEGDELTVTSVEQRYHLVNAGDKLALLARLLELEPVEQAIVFVRTRIESNDVAEALTKRGFPAEALNGDMTQDARSRTLNRLRRGELQLLVATDVAARGLDIDDITHVFNVDLPTDPELYVHRIGRTGRAGRTGVAISLVAPGEKRRLYRIQDYIRQKLTLTPIPSDEEVEVHRTAQVRDKLLLWLRRDRYARERVIVEGLLAETEYDPIDVAAAALKLARREESVRPIEPISPVRAERKRPTGGGRGHSPRHPKQGDGSFSRRSHEEGMVRLSLNTGRIHGIKPNEVVATLAYHGEIPGNSIGKIRIEQRFTLVDVPEQFVNQVLSRSGDYRIRHQRINVEIAS